MIINMIDLHFGIQLNYFFELPFHLRLFNNPGSSIVIRKPFFETFRRIIPAKNGGLRI